MKALEYLSQIRTLKERINSKEIVLDTLNDDATRITGCIEGEVVSHSRDVYAEQKLIAKIADLRTEINAENDALAELREEAEKMIHMIDDPTCETVLILRYIWLKEWDEVAGKVPCHPRYVYNYRDRGLRKMEECASKYFEIGQSITVDNSQKHLISGYSV